MFQKRIFIFDLIIPEGEDLISQCQEGSLYKPKKQISIKYYNTILKGFPSQNPILDSVDITFDTSNLFEMWDPISLLNSLIEAKYQGLTVSS